MNSICLRKLTRPLALLIAVYAGLTFTFPLLAQEVEPAAGSAEGVTVDTFVRAESDHMIRTNMAAMGVDFGKLVHLREPTTPENQPVIRMNQDTFYSGIVLDLTKPARIALPEADGRYMSMHVVSQDHYMFVESEPGTYELTQDKVGTRFALVTIRTFVDVTDPDDIAMAHAAQDAIELAGGGSACGHGEGCAGGRVLVCHGLQCRRVSRGK